MVSVSIGWRDTILRAKFHRFLWSALTGILTWLSLAVLLGGRLSLMFIVGILVHELGHAVVGRLCGLKKINIEFLPFFGAHTYFSNTFQSRRDFALMVLAGPGFGLIVGWISFGLYLLTGWSSLQMFAIWTILLSLMNLIPLSPLDGGHVMYCLMSPLRMRGVAVVELAGIALFLLGMYALGLPAVLIGLLFVLSLFIIVPFMRKVEDAERVRDAIAKKLNLAPTDIDAIVLVLRAADDEELLKIASDARRKRRRYFVGRLDYVTDDYWFADSQNLTHFLKGIFQRQMNWKWKSLVWLLFISSIGLCLLLAVCLAGTENVLIRLFTLAFSL